MQIWKSILDRALLYADSNTRDAVKNSIEYEIDTLLFSGKINGDTFGRLQKYLEDYLKSYSSDYK